MENNVRIRDVPGPRPVRLNSEQVEAFTKLRCLRIRVILQASYRVSSALDSQVGFGDSGSCSSLFTTPQALRKAVRRCEMERLLPASAQFPP